MASVGEALINACFHGQAREARRLLSGGADVNGEGQHGWTSLIVASQNGQVEIVDMLLAAQAAVNAANDEGCTALYRASCHSAASLSLRC